MNEKVKEVLESIVDRFSSGDIPKAISYAVFPRKNYPCDSWSIMNRTLVFIHNTIDARGFAQWKEVERHVKKGSKCFHILAPRFIKKVNEKTDTEETLLAGFITVPVFRCEDTEGKDLPEHKEIELPELPLMERAKEWGISVKAIGVNNKYYGYYQGDKIRLATPEQTVFFHELAHAAHDRIVKGLKCGQDNEQEIIAELSASVLCQLVGTEPDKCLGNNYRYIEQYAKRWNKTVYSACLYVLKTVGQVVSLIITGDEKMKLAA